MNNSIDIINKNKAEEESGGTSDGTTYGRDESGVFSDDGDFFCPADFDEPNSSRLREPQVAYGRKKNPGEFTLQDYYALPEDVRTELIDGVIYDMAAPALYHQSIAAELTTVFRNYIHGKDGQCLALSGPVDVQLNCDDKTMVQPDVLIVCDPDKIRKHVVFGAPDFVVEILSPSTKEKDRTLKLRKYREAGVREYWIVDPDREEVEVYLFQDPELITLPRVYRFQDIIPVGIYGGDCRVDFARVSRRFPGM